MISERNQALIDLLSWAVAEGARLKAQAIAQPPTTEGVKIAEACVGGVAALNRMVGEIRRMSGAALPADEVVT